LPFGGELSVDNHWVKPSKLIPWHLLERRYAYKFPSKKGVPATNVLKAYGSTLWRLLETDEALGIFRNFSDTKAARPRKSIPMSAKKVYSKLKAHSMICADL